MLRQAVGAYLLLGSMLFTHSGSAELASPLLMANTCTGCHGARGQSAGPAIPNIAGLDTGYFLRITQYYRDRQATSTIMGRITKGYSDEALTMLAMYYAQQPFVAQIQAYDAKKAALGAKLHQQYCEDCHEDGGRDSGGAGVLAGQWMPYLTFTLSDFQAGHRKAPKRMQRMLNQVDANGVDALVNFYGSQK